jgi:membrane protease YdiL (CAAX protease family)
MQRFFLNDNGRLRSGWRASIFLFSFLVLSVSLISVGLAIFAGDEQAVSGVLPLLYTYGVYFFAAVLLGWVLGLFFESVPFKALGWSLTTGWARHLISGLFLGFFTLLLTVIISVTSGGLQFSLNRSSAYGLIIQSLLGSSLVFAIGAAAEEAMLRGYLLQTFFRARSALIGALLSSLLFALAHKANPDATTLSLTNTFLAGIWFCVAYYRTRDLWFPFGIHFMWNWLQGPVFGINVSGLGSFANDPVLRATDTGPVWMTGGSYGVEGGAACTLAIVVAIVLTQYMPSGSRSGTSSAQFRRKARV